MDELNALLAKYLFDRGYFYLAENTGLYVILVSLFVGTIIPAITKLIRNLIRFIKQRKAIKDLHPYFLPTEIKAATNLYIDTKCQNIAPSDFEELRSNHAFAVQEDLMPFFLNKVLKFKSSVDNRFYFILSDSGMGKTTFLINLYIKYSNRFNSQFKIKLLPLGSSTIDEEIRNIGIEERRKTILLLDAFDEDIKASTDYKKRLTELVNLVWDFRIVIITSRTQFFASEEDEPNETGIFKFGGEKGSLFFQKIYISSFNDNDIRKYLRKKFSLFKLYKRKKGFKIVKNCPNLMVRPMLLAYIEDLLTLKYDTKNASQSYEALITKWIEREAMRIEHSNQNIFKIELRKFSDDLALDIYRNRQNRGGLFITGDEIKVFANRNKIKLEEIEMKSRSLLNRLSTGIYKFSHRSILEYLLATKLLYDKSTLGSIDIKTFDQTYKFYIEMLWDNLIQDKEKESIDLSHKLLYEIKPVSNFNNLKYIELNNNYLTDLSPLNECKTVIALQLDHNLIEDLNPIKDLHNLQFLFLKGNNISNITPLYGLLNLQQIDLTNNPIKLEQIESLEKSLINTEILFR